MGWHDVKYSFYYYGCKIALGKIFPFLSLLLLVFILGCVQATQEKTINSSDIKAQEKQAAITKEQQKMEKFEKEVITRLNYWTSFLERKSPPYIWGGVGEKGGDCSGQMYWIVHKSGLPYLRTTALQMWNGAWPGRVIKSWKNSRFPNLIYFTFSPKRPSGHVGIVRVNHAPNYLIYAEASSSAKIFKRTTLEAATAKDKSVTGIQELDLLVGFKKSISLK